MVKQLMSLVKDERGIQHAEEALLLALLAVALGGAVVLLQGSIEGVFGSAEDCMNDPTGAAC